MERRAFERIPTNLYARFFYGRKVYTGIVTNLSKNGMRIHTRACLPFKSKFVVIIPLIGKGLKIPVKVSRLIKAGEIHRGMGIELLKQHKKYLELVDVVRSNLFMLKHPLSNVLEQMGKTIIP